MPEVFSFSSHFPCPPAFRPTRPVLSKFIGKKGYLIDVPFLLSLFLQFFFFFVIKQMISSLLSYKFLKMATTFNQNDVKNLINAHRFLLLSIKIFPFRVYVFKRKKALMIIIIITRLISTTILTTRFVFVY